mmetsp:Transcript_36036/g.41771  ORF Transcript_36036/g.41771 Transcript_36036/m.41771 type:complete len:97 (-) Transcript_36036:78-368(-)
MVHGSAVGVFQDLVEAARATQGGEQQERVAVNSASQTNNSIKLTQVFRFGEYATYITFVACQALICLSWNNNTATVVPQFFFLKIKSCYNVSACNC